ncbi:class IV adenylate cyclase [Bacteroidota bacterium]
MRVINVEIKALCKNQERIRGVLTGRNADFMGKDHQVDTYFVSAEGRLKLREGNIENNLIYYERPDQEGPKTSHCILFSTVKDSSLKEILSKSMGILVVVDKEREIYFLDNVKVHLDLVDGLGTFVEIEAQSEEGDLSEEYLQGQCSKLMEEFGIVEADLVSDSYSDLMMNR